MLKFNPLTNTFDFVKSNNFSFNRVTNGSLLKIPRNQQMLVYSELFNSGNIVNDGEIVIFENTPRTRPIQTVAVDTTLNAEFFNVLVDCSASNVTLTLPSGGIYNQKEYNIKKIDSTTNKVLIIGTIDNGTDTELTVQYESITIQHDSSVWWIL
jgi:hypothetical protein